MKSVKSTAPHRRSSELTLAGLGVAPFESDGERRVGAQLVQLPGVARIDIHPMLANTNRRADFKVTGIGGSVVYVEVSMVGKRPRSDYNDLMREYRARLATKLAFYQSSGLGLPVIIWADELIEPALGARMREVSLRLAMPTPESNAREAA